MRKQIKRACEAGLKSLAIAGAVVMLPATNAVAVVTDKDIMNDATTTGDVVTYGMGHGAQRYSSLKKINSRQCEQACSGVVFFLRR